MPKQSTRFYRRDERDTNDDYGLKSRRDSGAGWINKLDGEDNDRIVSMKSTEAGSFRVTFADLAELEYQALIANKLPVFLVKDLTNDKRYFIIEESNLADTAKMMKRRTEHKSAEGEKKKEFVVPKIRKKQIIASPSDNDVYNRYHEKKENAY